MSEEITNESRVGLCASIEGYSSACDHIGGTYIGYFHKGANGWIPHGTNPGVNCEPGYIPIAFLRVPDVDGLPIEEAVTHERCAYLCCESDSSEGALMNVQSEDGLLDSAESGHEKVLPLNEKFATEDYFGGGWNTKPDIDTVIGDKAVFEGKGGWYVAVYHELADGFIALESVQNSAPKKGAGKGEYFNQEDGFVAPPFVRRIRSIQRNIYGHGTPYFIQCRKAIVRPAK